MKTSHSLFVFAVVLSVIAMIEGSIGNGILPISTARADSESIAQMPDRFEIKSITVKQFPRGVFNFPVPANDVFFTLSYHGAEVDDLNLIREPCPITDGIFCLGTLPVKSIRESWIRLREGQTYFHGITGGLSEGFLQDSTTKLNLETEDGETLGSFSLRPLLVQMRNGVCLPLTVILQDPERRNAMIEVEFSSSKHHAITKCKPQKQQYGGNSTDVLVEPPTTDELRRTSESLKLKAITKRMEARPVRLY